MVLDLSKWNSKISTQSHIATKPAHELLQLCRDWKSHFSVTFTAIFTLGIWNWVWKTVPIQLSKKQSLNWQWSRLIWSGTVRETYIIRTSCSEKHLRNSTKSITKKKVLLITCKTAKLSSGHTAMEHLHQDPRTQRGTESLDTQQKCPSSNI